MGKITQMHKIVLIGETYDNREFIKAYQYNNRRIFFWDAAMKEWYGWVEEKEIDLIVEDIAEEHIGMVVKTTGDKNE